MPNCVSGQTTLLSVRSAVSLTGMTLCRVGRALPKFRRASEPLTLFAFGAAAAG